MHKEFLMGNEAIALGAIAAGVNLIVLHFVLQFSYDSDKKGGGR